MSLTLCIDSPIVDNDPNPERQIAFNQWLSNSMQLLQECASAGIPRNNIAVDLLLAINKLVRATSHLRKIRDTLLYFCEDMRARVTLGEYLGKYNYCLSSPSYSTRTPGVSLPAHFKDAKNDIDMKQRRESLRLARVSLGLSARRAIYDSLRVLGVKNDEESKIVFDLEKASLFDVASPAGRRLFCGQYHILGQLLDYAVSYHFGFNLEDGDAFRQYSDGECFAVLSRWRGSWRMAEYDRYSQFWFSACMSNKKIVTSSTPLRLIEILRGLSVFMRPLIDAYEAVKQSLTVVLRQNFFTDNVFKILDYDYLRGTGRTIVTLKDEERRIKSLKPLLTAESIDQVTDKENVMSRINAYTAFLDAVAPALRILMDNELLCIALTEGDEVDEVMEAAAFCYGIHAGDMTWTLVVEEHCPRCCPPWRHNRFGELFKTLDVRGGGPWRPSPKRQPLLIELEEARKKFSTQRPWVNMEELGTLVGGVLPPSIMKDQTSSSTSAALRSDSRGHPS